MKVYQTAKETILSFDKIGILHIVNFANYLSEHYILIKPIEVSYSIGTNCGLIICECEDYDNNNLLIIYERWKANL